MALAHLEIIFAGFFFGLLGVLGKQVFSLGFTPGELLALRFLISSSVLALVLAVFNRQAFQLPLRIVLRCFVLGVFGYALFSSMFFMALARLPASLTVLLLYLYPVFVTLGGALFFGEKVGGRQIGAVFLALMGLTFLLNLPEILNGTASVSSTGVLLGIGSAVFYSIYILGSKRWVAGFSPWGVIFYIQAAAALVLSLIEFRVSDTSALMSHLQSAWILFFIIGVVCTLLAMSLFLRGLQKLPGYQVSVLSMSEPVTGVVLAVLFLGESFLPVQGLGAVGILAAMVLLLRR
jgi:drug/metabolite transporter, DME family